MDIENMHPFCLPFGLCHDATSSSLADVDEFGAPSDATSGDPNGDSVKQSNNNPIGRSSTTSPTGDQLFRHLSNNGARAASLLHDDLLLLAHESPSSINDPFGAYSSLDLDTDIDGHFEGEPRKLRDLINEDELLAKSELEEEMEAEEDSWYCSQQFSLLSPPPHGKKTATNPLSNHHHQVFQHVVDPIDIKSSPTLAQLNLNSQDDPTGDGLWATISSSSTLNSSASSASSASSSSSSSSSSLSGSSNSHTDLLISNCTSISINRHLPGAAHHNHHQHLHHPHHHNLQYLHAHNNNNNHLHSSSQYQQQSMSSPAFKKPDLQPTYQAAACCHHNHQNLAATSPNLATTSPQQLNQANILAPNTQHQQAFNNNNNNNSESSICPTTAQQQQQLSSSCLDQNKQRSASPALVTSSSSPLSSSASTTTALVGQQQQIAATSIQHQQHPATQENNKLKENIEYLTALLCNGNNKLDQQQLHPQNHQQQHQHPQQQQQNQQQHQHQQHQQQQQHQLTHQQQSNGSNQPSSTMINRSSSSSYSTLAHSLSTGPKLLERHHQHHQQHHHFGPTGGKAAATTTTGDQQQQQGLKRSLYQAQADQWPTVESSVSAADSTGDQSQPSSTQQQQQRGSELKVLSSLLNANKCAQQQQPQQQQVYIAPQSQPTAGWQQEQPQQAYNHQAIKQEPLPPMAQGKPITLTPIVNTTQQQPPVVVKQQAKFVQPASPSASSTGSSVDTTGSASASGSGSPAIKRVRQLQPANPATKAPTAATTGGNNNRGRPNSMSTDCSQSSSSHDEGFSSQMDQDECGEGSRADDSEHEDEEDEVDSDDESFYGDYTNSDLIGASISDNADNKWTLNMGRTRRNGQKRFFWQYNVQSKGPKGARLCPSDDLEDPFILPEASDPVFSQDCQVEGVKHSGKARRGDGNDLTPNPRKLLMIGLELKKLGKIINELAPVTDLPVQVRNKTRKEKNKLASRACRLKKKAQHEANKIKLYGLQREHQQVVLAIYDIRKLLNETLLEFDQQQQQQQNNNNKLAGFNQQQQQQQQQLKSTTTTAAVKTIAEQCSMNVAGQTSDYVNSVLEKVVSGCIDGGLQT